MKNQLYYGDNLEILRNFVADESVDLCYIDPPFNSKRNYNQIYNNIGSEDKAQTQAFVDTWLWGEAANMAFQEIVKNKDQVYTPEVCALVLGLRQVLKESGLMAYLLAMTQRIAEIHRVLKPTGSFYLHCDPTASHYLKLLCDALFCTRGGDFKNEIVWEKTRVPKAQSLHFAKQQDVILFYSKSDSYLFKLQYKQPNPEYIKKYFSQTESETGRKYQLVSFLQDGQGQAKRFGDRVIEPPRGKHWIWTQERIDEAMEKGWLIFTNPDKPRLKKYLDEQIGKNIGSIWNDIPPINSQAKERLGYPTQKPEALLERIIEASSNENDVVLDCFCGCGTTIAVAEKMNRKWIGIDITYQSISLILKRLEDSFGSNFTEDIRDQEKQIKIPAKVILQGEPEDFEAAVALANRQDDRLRKEFEKWAVLKFSKNRAFINDKKGGDGGIDGMAYMLDYDENHKEISRKVLFSVKSNKNLNPTVVRDLVGTLEREKAAVGYLISLYPVENLVKEATKYGFFENSFGQSFPKITIVSIQELLDGLRMNLPLPLDILKSAELKKRDITESLF